MLSAAAAIMACHSSGPSVSVLPRDVRFLLRIYGVTDGEQCDLLLALARESRQKGWWHQYGDAIPESFEIYVGLEAEATTLRNYESEFVPGLLQTEDYTRAVHRAFLVTSSDEDIEQRVAVRMARQRRLSAPEAPQLWAIVNEAVIRRAVGGRTAMRAQLNHLIDASRKPNITVQVLPFSVGAHAAMDGAFMILDFPEPADPNVVYIEYHSGTLYLEKTAEVQRYKLIFDHLRAAALPVDASRALIARAADEIT